MTEEEITDLKVLIGQELGEKLEKAFVGQSITEASALVVKSYIDQILKDLIQVRKLNPVVELVEWNVRFEGNTMHAVMEPKKGLSDADHRRAVNFLFNQGDD